MPNIRPIYGKPVDIYSISHVVVYLYPLSIIRSIEGVLRLYGTMSIKRTHAPMSLTYLSMSREDNILIMRL
jgi:hypothetical protein